ncbi:MAG: hypothetical protein KH202_05875 [Clostridiales bacterium]|nr:hypothetical protein [Clostridiales bacterium]
MRKKEKTAAIFIPEEDGNCGGFAFMGILRIKSRHRFLWQFLVLTARKKLYRSVARIASENRFAAGS